MLNAIMPADAASNPSPTLMAVIVPPDHWVKSSYDPVYTTDVNNVTWKGPKADNVSLYYIVDGKEYFIARARGDRNYYLWNVPDQPVPSQPSVMFFRDVRLKAVWQDQVKNSAGKTTFQNLTTQYSEDFTLAKTGAFFITTPSLPTAYVGEAYGYTLRASGGEKPYHWYVKAGYSLPSGLALGADGRISGTPAAYSSYPTTVRFCVQDSGVDALHDEADLSLFVTQRGSSATPIPDPFDYRLEMSDWSNTTTVDRPATGQVTVHKTLSVRWAGGAPRSVTLSVTGNPAGLDCSLSPRTGLPAFDSAFNITVRNTLAPGRYPVVIHAVTDTGMERTLTYTVVVTNEATTGDLVLERPYELHYLESSKAIVPMQVFYESPYLIKGKNTIFRATVRSTFDTDMDVRVELWLPTEDWEWEGVPYGAGMDLRTEDMGTYPFPEHYIYNRTFTVPANSAVEIFLPEPSELVEETVHSSPHMYMDELTIVTSAPRPRHNGGEDIYDEPEYTVVVDPANRITESNERNNCPYQGTEHMQTHSTAALNMLITPVISDNYEIEDFWPGGVTGTAFEDDFWDNIQPQARNGSEFMLGVYPVGDEKFSYYLSQGVMSFHERGGDSNHFYMQRDMSDMAAENGYDRIVGLVPEGFGDAGWDAEWLGVVFGHNPRACFVLIDKNLTMVMVHENYHNLGHDDVYGDGPVYASDSYWVNKQRTRTVSDDDLRDYMEYVLINDSLGYPIITNPYWTSKTRFETVMRDLPDVEDPEVLLFRCVVHKNGSVDLDPFMIVDGIPDVEPETWNYKVVLKDASGKVVREQKEDVAFVMSLATVQGKPGGTMPYDKAFISSTIPWSDNVTLVELQDAAGKVVASRAVSKNPPTVKFTAPAAGDVWVHGKTHALKWSASDPDGDMLSYSLAMSTDKTTWIPVAIDVKSNEYEFDTKTMQPGEYYFRVRATDGVLSANDTTEQSIRITGESALPLGTTTPASVPGQAALPGMAIFIGAIIVVVLVIIVVASGGYLLIKRK